MKDPKELVRMAQVQQQAARYGFLVGQANARMAEQIRKQSDAPVR